jgi:hypothetical protein
MEPGTTISGEEIQNHTNGCKTKTVHVADSWNKTQNHAKLCNSSSQRMFAKCGWKAIHGTYDAVNFNIWNLIKIELKKWKARSGSMFLTRPSIRQSVRPCVIICCRPLDFQWKYSLCIAISLESSSCKTSKSNEPPPPPQYKDISFNLFELWQESNYKEPVWISKLKVEWIII